MSTQTDMIQDSIKCISNVFEIRLNPQKKQDLFDNIEHITSIKKMIKLLTNINVCMYVLENSNNTVYIYYKNNKFYHFEKGHYNFRLNNMNYYTCRINDMNYNKFIIECNNSYEESTIHHINTSDFIDLVVDIDMYEENILNIFLQD